MIPFSLNLTINVTFNRENGPVKTIANKDLVSVLNDLAWILSQPVINGIVLCIHCRKEWFINVSLRAKSDSLQVMILNPGFMKYVHENWLGKKGRYPSTGFMTLALSMHMCDEVGLFPVVLEFP